MTRELDGIVVGAGPAGRSLAQALGHLGLDVLCLDPRGAEPWRTTWGLWQDEVEALGLGEVVAATAVRPLVRFAHHDEVVLARSYGVLDAERLRAHLSAGVQVASECARAVRPGEVELESGATLRARLVIDTRPPRRTGCAQTAVGRVVRTRGLAPVLMDFSIAHADSDPRPSFAYVVPLDAEHTLVEETALAAAPPMSDELLARRLGARLRALGVEGALVSALPAERVRIPLDVPVPRAREGLVRFGVGGAAVHPATGYALAGTLGDAPVLAASIAAALAEGQGPAQVATTALRALWPWRRRLRRALLEHGRDVLLSLDLAGQRSFFRAFFALPPELQRAFLSASGSPATVSRAMAGLWGDLSWSLRARAIQRRSVALIEPGAGTCQEPKEHRSRVPRGTRRGRDAGIVARTKPGDHQRN